VRSHGYRWGGPVRGKRGHGEGFIKERRNRKGRSRQLRGEGRTNRGRTGPWGKRKGGQAKIKTKGENGPHLLRRIERTRQFSKDDRKRINQGAQCEKERLCLTTNARERGIGGFSHREETGGNRNRLRL